MTTLIPNGKEDLWGSYDSTWSQQKRKIREKEVTFELSLKESASQADKDCSGNMNKWNSMCKGSEVHKSKAS